MNETIMSEEKRELCEYFAEIIANADEFQIFFLRGLASGITAASSA